MYTTQGLLINIFLYKTFLELRRIFFLILFIIIPILFIIIGGYGVATSAGDPERLEAAKQRITAAVAGLLFILLSVLILRIIGEEVIGIRPGLFGL